MLPSTHLLLFMLTLVATLYLLIVFKCYTMELNSEKFLEIVNVLTSSNCPLIIRNDKWWIEELFFKPGIPRTELILWIVSKLTNSVYPYDFDQDSTATSTASSNFYRLPETDEALLDLLCVGGICCESDMPFVKGSLPMNQQMKYWELLIKPLQNIEKPFSASLISTGYNTINNLTTMENFLDAFHLSATLLPPDIQSEIKQNPPKFSEESFIMPQGPNLLFDDQSIQMFSEQTEELKKAAENFTSIYNSDLKIISMKHENHEKLVNIEGNGQIILNKMRTWKKDIDSLLELQKMTTLDSVKQKVDLILQQSVKDESYQYLKELRNRNNN